MRKKLIISMMFLMVFFLVGCDLLEQIQQPVTNQPPKASFTLTPATPKVNEVVTFNPANSSDQHDSIYQLSTRWDFDGDGIWEIDYSAGKTAAQVVTYSYDEAKVYTVVLEVRDSEGLTHQTFKNVTVEEEQTPTTNYSVAGHIVESRGGQGIGQATVKLVSRTGAVFTRTTGLNGEFEFGVTDQGPYELTVTKSGYASSRVQNLLADQGYSTALDLPLRESVVPSWSTNPPEIIVTGFGGGPISTWIEYTVDVQGDLPLQFGEVQYGPQGFLESPTSFEMLPAQMYLDPESLPNGETYIRISVYDINENYTEYYQPIVIQTQTPVATLDVPVINVLQAMTFGKSLELLSEQTKKLMTEKVDPALDFDQIQTEAIQSNASLVTGLSWICDDQDVAGYKIYRSTTSESQGFSLIGVINDPWLTGFIDTSSVLTPGQPVYYRVSAYNASGESAMSETVSTTPLAPFRVSLVAPAPDAVVTTAQPTFTWTYDQLVGENQYYYLMVAGVTDDHIAIQSFEMNTTSSGYYYEKLETGKEYEWNLEEVYAETIYSEVSSAVSVSNYDWTTMNGWYRFRTEF